MKTGNFPQFTVSRLKKKEVNKRGWVEYTLAMYLRDDVSLEIAIFLLLVVLSF